MKKSLMIVLTVLALTSICAAAAADKYDFLKPMWLNALENMQESREEGVSREYREPKVVCGDEQLEVVRYAVYLDDEYDPEAYLYAELKNTGEQVIRINGTSLTVLDASGKRLSECEYVTAKPDVVMPGSSLFIMEWMYDFVSDLSRVDSIQITLEYSEYSRKKIEALNETHAYVDGDYLYAEVTNTTEKPLFEIGVSAVALDKDGKILDMLCEETYSGVGAAPGSTIVFRKMLDQRALDTTGVVCEAEAYVYDKRY